MRVEDPRLRSRLLRPALIALLVLGGLAVPAWLWLVRGRPLPLRAVLDPPAYAVQAGATLPLRLHITPRDVAGHVVVSWEGEGVRPARDPARTTWRAPARPGAYTVKVAVRRAGTTVKDSVTIQVLRTSPGTLPVSRPPSSPPPPRGLPPCARPAPRVKLHGTPCAGGNLVLELTGAPPGARAWHAVEGGHPRGGAPWAELLVPVSSSPTPGSVVSSVVPAGAACAWTVRTPLALKGCVTGPGAAEVFADFSWQMVSPGHFRFAAKPSRTEGLVFERYLWDFGDGTRKEGKAPQIAHRYKGPPARWHLVALEVVAPKGRARTLRLVVDRSVQE